MTVKLLQGDCVEVMRAELSDNSVHAIVCDPPYHLTTNKKGGTGTASLNLASPAGRSRVTTGFMGKAWDGGDVAFRVETWAEAWRVLKPGGYLLAFGGTRTYHRMVCAIEDAGFEIRDRIPYYRSGQPDRDAFFDSLTDEQRELFLEAYGRPSELAWVYGSGFPKSLDVSKQLDSNGDAVRQWEGWGTALKPSHEPIVVARKPLIGTVAANVLAYGTGALNIDGCRVGSERPLMAKTSEGAPRKFLRAEGRGAVGVANEGRWPANLITDGSDEVVACFPDAPGQLALARTDGEAQGNSVYGALAHITKQPEPRNDIGSAARFFYCAKASAEDRGEGNDHPTVKPASLMQYLCRLVTPPGGIVLDIFAGSGSTLLAADREGFDAIGIELDQHNIEIARRRIESDSPLFAEVA